MNDLKNNIEQGKDINPNEIIVFIEKDPKCSLNILVTIGRP